MVSELKALPLFALCSDEDLEELLESPHRRREYIAGESIMGTGEKIQSLLVLCSGKVETRMEGEENRELVLDHLKAPCVLAPAFLFASDNSAPVDVRAMERCIIWSFDREGMLHFMAAHPEVMRRFLRMVSDRCRFLSEKVRTFAIKGLRKRVLDYIRTHGSINRISTVAEYLGVTRPSLSRLISEMLADGTLCRTCSDGKTIVRNKC